MQWPQAECQLNLSRSRILSILLSVPLPETVSDNQDKRLEENAYYIFSRLSLEVHVEEATTWLLVH